MNWGALSAIWRVGTTLYQYLCPKYKIELNEIPAWYRKLTSKMDSFDLQVIVGNRGSQPITILEAGFMTVKEERLKWYNYFGTQLPTELRPLHCVVFERVSPSVLPTALKELGYRGEVLIKVFVKDSIHDLHYRYYLYDIDKRKIVDSELRLLRSYIAYNWLTHPKRVCWGIGVPVIGCLFWYLGNEIFGQLRLLDNVLTYVRCR